MIMTQLLVKEHNVRFPDFTGDDAYDVDVSKLTRFPSQLIVVPQLHTHTDRHTDRQTDREGLRDRQTHTQPSLCRSTTHFSWRFPP